MVAHPSTPNKPSGSLKPTAKGCLAMCRSPLLRRKQQNGAPLPTHSGRCPGRWVAPQLAPPQPPPKWKRKSLPLGKDEIKPRCTCLGWGTCAGFWIGFAPSHRAGLWPRRRVNTWCWCPRLSTASGPLSTPWGLSMRARVWVFIPSLSRRTDTYSYC
jgi:hypothetical protein